MEDISSCKSGHIAGAATLAKVLASVMGLVAHLEDSTRRYDVPTETFIDEYARMLARGIGA